MPIFRDLLLLVLGRVNNTNISPLNNDHHNMRKGTSRTQVDSWWINNYLDHPTNLFHLLVPPSHSNWPIVHRHITSAILKRHEIWINRLARNINSTSKVFREFQQSGIKLVTNWTTLEYISFPCYTRKYSNEIGDLFWNFVSCHVIFIYLVVGRCTIDIHLILFTTSLKKLTCCDMSWKNTKGLKNPI